MTYRWNVRLAGLVLAALIALSAFGCGDKPGVKFLIPNERPRVELTSAPIDTRDTSFYAYRLYWSGVDADGRVDHYLYATDPTPTDTTWTLTRKNEETIFFLANDPVLGGRRTDPLWGVDIHTFAIKAVDNLGVASPVISRTFTSYTVCPTVQLTGPRPSPSSTARVTPSVRINWVGTDPDGQLRQKPAKYKYKLLRQGNPEFDIDYAVTRDGPEAFRQFYAPDFAGWDSVGGDTTTVQYTGLVPENTYLFVVVGFDEAGAYNADFSTSTNMLRFAVSYAGTQGPKIYIYNEFYQYGPASGFSPTSPSTWQHLEIPAGQRIVFNWFAVPPDGADIEWYRWRIDGNIDDETERSNEETDWYHWSQKSVSVISCQIGPFFSGETRTFYLEAKDNNDMLSLITLKLKPVVPTMNDPVLGRELLIVDDTRREAPRFVSGVRREYGLVWPAMAELDTFFFAIGGTPWMDVITNPKPTTPSGIFRGYGYDTTGTRQGRAIASEGVPFSKLAQYRHMIWYTDAKGATDVGGPTNAINPMSTLKWMCSPGHNNTFSTYTYAGGKVWLFGGGGANASLWNYNATGVDNNDDIYGFAVSRIYAGPEYVNRPGQGKEELAPGRLMYDGAHWQSLMAIQAATGSVLRSPKVLTYINTPSWLNPPQPGYQFAEPVSRPDYNRMPTEMHKRTNPASDPVNGDPLPPTRPASYAPQWWSPSPLVDFEYLIAPNHVIEDMDRTPLAETLIVAQDTLMRAQGTNLVNSTGVELICMTWYHGVKSPSFIFSGFPIWMWRRSDVQLLVDFVMQEIWHLPKSTVPSGPAYRAFRNPFAPASSPSGSRSVGARLPSRRSGSK